MAQAPKRRCPHCPQYMPCEKHSGQADRERGSSTERGYDRAWQRLRRAFLAEYPLCMDCSPRVTVATEVHHVRKVRDYPQLRLEWSNLMACCRACHQIRTARGE